MDQERLSFGRKYEGSREALRRELQAIRGLEPLEQRILEWLFSRIWPPDAPGLQPLKTSADEIRLALTVNHKPVRTALRRLENRGLIQRFSHRDGWHVELDTDVVFGIRNSTSSPRGFGTDDLPATAPRDSSMSAPAEAPRGIGGSSPEVLEMLLEMRDRLNRWERLFEGRPPASTGEASPQDGEASPQDGEASPAFPFKERKEGREERLQTQNPFGVLSPRRGDCFKDPSSSLPSIHEGRPPQASPQDGEASPSLSAKAQVDRLGFVHVEHLRLPRGLPQGADEIQRATVRAKALRGFQHAADLFARFSEHGHVTAAERDQVFLFLFTAASVAWIQKHKVGRPDRYLLHLIVNGDWKHHQADELRDTAAACSRWYESQRSPNPQEKQHAPAPH